MNVYGFDLIKEAVKKARRESDMDWLEIKDHFAFDQSAESLRKYSVAWKLLEDWNLVNFDTVEQSKKLANENRYKETTEIKQDGTHASDKLVAMSEEDSKDVNFLLKAHGFDSGAWELLSAKNNIWNVSNGDLANKTLYSSKITVKPIANGLDISKIIEKSLKNVKPYKRKTTNIKGKNLLELFLTDMHFGVNTLEDYQSTLDEIIELIESKSWDTIYIPIGSDLLHNDDFKGRTTNDTIIEKVDMELAWEEAFTFYCAIYEKALENAENVVSHYICGNHDKVMSFGLVKSLSKLFPEVEWDTTTTNKKLFTWKDVAILAMHGDKGTQRIAKTIYKDYGKLISDKKVVEIHSGDKHYTKTDDSHGVIFRILPTKAKTDDWHFENSFTSSMKAFHLFEYSEDKLKTIYHV